jgi:hypothetical protein
MKLTRREFAALSGAAGLSVLAGEQRKYKAPIFKDDMDSLKHYRAPEWFRDAKFGI